MKVICRMDFHALKLESLKQMVEFFNPSHLGQSTVTLRMSYIDIGLAK